MMETLAQSLPACIWYGENGACTLIKSHHCGGADCSFRKTATQFTHAAAAWRSRMASLSEEDQLRIAKKYYGGNMPWK